MELNSIGYYSKGALIVLGGMVLLGHLFHQPVLVQLLPGMIAMVPNTAINFILLGIALLLSAKRSLIPSLINITLFSVISILSILSLSEDIFQYTLGIDQWMPSEWLKDPSPTPGRMAPNTSGAFLLSVLVSVLIPYGNKKGIGVIIQLATVFILFIALFSLLIYGMKWEFIFNWYRFPRMAAHTAFGFVLVSVALGSTWLQTQWYKTFYEGIQDKKIMLVTGLILLFITLISGLGSIANLTSINILTVQRAIETILKDRVADFIETTEVIQQDIADLARFNSRNLNEALYNDINKILTAKNYSSIQILDINGKPVYSKGTLKQNRVNEVPLKFNYKASLFWEDGFWLKIHSPLHSEPGHVLKGYLITEKLLSQFSKEYINYEGLGKTGEIMVCRPFQENGAECFPSRFDKQKYNLKIVNNGYPLAIYYAFIGLKGAINTLDYKGNKIIAAFSPIGDSGLGMVVKIQSKEIYAPIRTELEHIIPIGLILIVFGLSLLYWQVAPLVRKVINSEKEAQQHKLETIELNNQLTKRNKEVQLLRELSSSLQSVINLEELFALVHQYGKQILPDEKVIFFLMHSSHNYLECKCEWGSPLLNEHIIKPEDCWALRKGTLHQINSYTTNIMCPHSKGFGESPPPYMCIPMLAQNDIIGLFYLETNNSKVSITQENTELVNLAITFCEQISLSIANTKLRESLRNQAIHDKLTGLFNRRYLEETMDREINRLERNSSSLALLMIDIDHFKYFNDTFGHEAGDVVLQSFGQSLLKYSRTSDIACRFGGEEFLLVLLDISLEEALVRAKIIHQLVSQLHLSYKQSVLGPITLSIGISMCPAHGNSLEELIPRADAALYEAKNTGRNKTVVYAEKKV